jgi:hypothetical protein
MKNILTLCLLSFALFSHAANTGPKDSKTKQAEAGNPWGLAAMATNLNSARFNFITTKTPPYNCTVNHFPKKVWKKETPSKELKANVFYQALLGKSEDRSYYTVIAMDDNFGIEVSYNKNNKATTCKHWERFVDSNGKESSLMYISSNRDSVCEECKNVARLIGKS